MRQGPRTLGKSMLEVYGLPTELKSWDMQFKRRIYFGLQFPRLQSMVAAQHTVASEQGQAWLLSPQKPVAERESKDRGEEPISNMRLHSLLDQQGPASASTFSTELLNGLTPWWVCFCTTQSLSGNSSYEHVRLWKDILALNQDINKLIHTPLLLRTKPIFISKQVLGHR